MILSDFDFTLLKFLDKILIHSYFLFFTKFNMIDYILFFRFKPYPFKKIYPSRWTLKRKNLMSIKNFKNFNLLKKYFKFSSSTVQGLYFSIKRFWRHKFLRKSKIKFNKFFFLHVKARHLRNFSIFKFLRIKIFFFKKKFMSFSINQRLFLSSLIIKKSLWRFLYSKVKSIFLVNKTKPSSSFILFKKLIFFNGYKPLIKKMRKSRYVHWKFRTTGKLNQWRYDKLLSVELKFLVKNKSLSLLSFIIIRSYCVILSWRQLFLLLKYNLFLINGIYNPYINSFFKGDIIELPFKINRTIILKNKKFRWDFKKIIAKSKKISYKSFTCRRRKLHKPLVPKIFKKLPLGLKRFGFLIAYDYSLNLIALIHNIKTFTHDVNYNLVHNSVLTLQNWRYRFD